MGDQRIQFQTLDTGYLGCFAAGLLPEYYPMLFSFISECPSYGVAVPGGFSGSLPGSVPFPVD